jgi:hypothetical protein
MEVKELLTRQSVIRKISDSALYGNLGLFIGAGVSKAILNENGDEIALSWGELLDKSAKAFNIDLSEVIKDGSSYPDIATNLVKHISENEEIEYKAGLKKLKQKISELTCWYPDSESRKIYGKLFEDLSPLWIITTNYDLIIECLLTGKSISLGPDEQLITPKGLIPIYHLHGTRTNPDSIIITQEDYISLFRPNQYRQQKLSLTIKESTTLIIGYNLGDTNVLTAVDWSINVYSEQRITYPNEIIQLLYKETKSSKKPYKDQNGIIILEYNNLHTLLEEIVTYVQKEKVLKDNLKKEIDEINQLLKDPSKTDVCHFIDNNKFRIELINEIKNDGIQLISGFLEIYSKAVEETWERSMPDRAFEGYNENLIIQLDILENISLKNIPPALFEAIAYNLEKVAFYIGNQAGKSFSANQTWNKRRKDVPNESIIELKSISKSRLYYNLKKILKDI